MKPLRIKILEIILKWMAKVVLKVHEPKIVAITGSVGKTSTKAAVFAVLSEKFYVRENQKNYNNEIGIPLTIIGVDSGGKNIFKWLWIFCKWIMVIIVPRYPDILILELGVDHPGDMQYFMSFLHPTVGIVTNVSVSHIEFFKTVENIAKEKGFLIESIGSDGYAILNADDAAAMALNKRTLAQVFSFGKSEMAKVGASSVVYNYNDDKPEGISFKLNYDGKNIPIRLKNILALHYVYPALASIAVGIIFKINLVEIAKYLGNFHAPAGRMNLIEGKNGSFVIDDTYNASPISTLAAIEVLEQLKSKRKIAILGDMLELGDISVAKHREIGKAIFAAKIDIFVAIGKRMNDAVGELVALGFPSSNIFKFDDPNLAKEKVEQMLLGGDFVLVKGSQGMRMEKIVEGIMKNQEEKKNLLCRQSAAWTKKPFIKP
ncbi:MAG: UDP-N-acetylmuramoyl-tripeptide--D-alanyl-D-alanine ligase [bacterium]